MHPGPSRSASQATSVVFTPDQEGAEAAIGDRAGVIGPCKEDGHRGRNFLKGRLANQVNAVMNAIGDNFRLILKGVRNFCA